MSRNPRYNPDEKPTPKQCATRALEADTRAVKRIQRDIGHAYNLTVSYPVKIDIGPIQAALNNAAANLLTTGVQSALMDLEPREIIAILGIR